MRPRPSGNASSIGPEVNDGLLQYFEQRGTALPSEIEVFTQQGTEADEVHPILVRTEHPP